MSFKFTDFVAFDRTDNIVAMQKVGFDRWDILTTFLKDDDTNIISNPSFSV